MGGTNTGDSKLQNLEIKEFFPVQIFYCLVLFDFIRDTLNALSAILVNPPDNFAYPYTLKFLGLAEKDILCVALILIGIAVNFFVLTKPHSQAGRIAAFGYFLLSKGFIFSATRFNHHYIPMTWALLCLCLYSSEINEQSRKLYRKVYSLLLFSIASFYFFPGLWKVLYGLMQKELWQQEFGANTIASFFLSQGQKGWLGPFLIEHEVLAYLGFLVIILLQLSAIYAWWNSNYQRLWAVFILAFHAISILVLNVNFFVAGAVTFLFFFLSPFVDTQNDWWARFLKLSRLSQSFSRSTRGEK